MSKVMEQNLVEYSKGTHKYAELDQIYVKINGEIMPLNKAGIYYYEDGKKAHTFISVDDFVSKLHHIGTLLVGDNQTLPESDVTVFVALDAIDEKVETEISNEKKLLSKSYCLIKQTVDLNQDNYIKVKFAHAKDEEYIKKSEMTFEDKDGLTYNLFDEMAKGLTAEQIQDLGTVFYCQGKEVETFDLDFDYKKTKPYAEQIYNDQKARFESITTKEYISIDGVTHKKNELGQTRAIVPTLTVVTPLGKSKIPDPKHPGKEKEVKKDKIQNFHISNVGEYISVDISGERGNMPVKIEDLSFGGKPVERGELVSLVGKKLTAKTAKGSKITEPLTYMQALCCYEPVKFYEPSTNQADAMKDNAYLRLTNGHLVKEASVQPIAYDISKNDEYDAYLFVQKDGDKYISHILSAEYIDHLAGKNFAIDGKVYPKAELKKLKRTANVSKADVLQTETKDQASKCELMVNPNRYTKLSNASELRQEVYKNFVADYKSGKYNVDKVAVGGTLVAVQKYDSRLMEKDSYEAIDYAENTSDYKSLNTKPIEVVTQKNGQIKLVQGGPKINVWKSTINSYKKISTLLIGGGLGMLSLPGLLIAAAVPSLVTGAAIVLASGFVVVPVYNLVRATVKNLTHLPVADKSKIAQAQAERDVRDDLKSIHSNTLNMKLDRFAEFYEGSILDRFVEVENDLMRMSKTNRIVTLKMSKGKGEVSLDNASQAQYFINQFNKELKQNTKDKKKMAKLKQQHTSLLEKLNAKDRLGQTVKDKEKDKLNNLKNELDAITKTVDDENSIIAKKQSGEISLSSSVEAHKNYLREQENLTNFKSFVLVRLELSKAIKGKKAGEVEINGEQYSVDTVRKFLNHSNCKLDKGARYGLSTLDKFTTEKKLAQGKELNQLMATVQVMLKNKAEELSSFKRVVKADDFTNDKEIALPLDDVVELEHTDENVKEKPKELAPVPKKEPVPELESAPEVAKVEPAIEEAEPKVVEVEPTVEEQPAKPAEENEIPQAVETPTETPENNTIEQRTSDKANNDDGKEETSTSNGDATTIKEDASVPKEETPVVTKENMDKYLDLLEDSKAFVDEYATEKLTFTKANLAKLKKAMKYYVALRKKFTTYEKVNDPAYVYLAKKLRRYCESRLKAFISANDYLLDNLNDEWNEHKKAGDSKYKWLTSEYFDGIMDVQSEYLKCARKNGNDIDIGGVL